MKLLKTFKDNKLRHKKPLEVNSPTHLTSSSPYLGSKRVRTDLTTAASGLELLPSNSFEYNISTVQVLGTSLKFLYL
jgi:hypothetical protein